MKKIELPCECEKDLQTAAQELRDSLGGNCPECVGIGVGDDFEDCVVCKGSGIKPKDYIPEGDRTAAGGVSTTAWTCVLSAQVGSFVRLGIGVVLLSSINSGSSAVIRPQENCSLEVDSRRGRSVRSNGRTGRSRLLTPDTSWNLLDRDLFF